MPSRLIYGSADLFWFWIKNAKARHSRAGGNGGGGVGNILRVGGGAWIPACAGMTAFCADGCLFEGAAFVHVKSAGVEWVTCHPRGN